jgi:putative ABC transport system permease protein
MPKTSHLIPQALYPIHDPEGQMEQPQAWGNFSLYTYALLQPGTDLQAFEDKLAALNQEFVKPIFDQFGLTLKYETLRLSDIHLRSDFQGEPEPTGSMEYIYIFTAIGVFLLVLACINYMNLATARSQRRAREVGVRKTMGAHRSHLISQFLAESLLLALLALGASLLVVYASLPFFNQILDLPLRFAGLWQPVVLLSMLGILLLTGLVAGSYPALYLSGFHPAHVLKGSSGQTTGGNHRLRQGLVVLQFVISLFMLVSTGVVYDQLRFLNQKDLGFSTDPLLKFSISNPSDREKWPVLRHKLLSLPGVENAGTARSLPGMGYNKNLMPIESESGEMVERTIDQYPVDYDYFETMEMEIVQGRNFDRSRGLDSAQAVLVNQAMVRRMGWTDPIGKKVSFDLQGNDNLDAEVIGVVRDFHQQSLYEAISALMFTRGGHQRMQVLRIHPSNVEQTLADVQSAWRAVFPTLPFEYEFLDEAFMEQYEAEKHRSQLFTLFSLLTVLIACLGLLGLASFMAEQRTREMGIRKIVGASVPQLMQLMTREFLLLVLVATPIAFGLAWYFMRDWLSEFAYHVDLSVLTFGGALLMTLLITLATTSYHALRAATINPAEALRQE